MLQSLHIENVAVIKSVDIDFNFGFMALTGETGAGKSIILDSLGLLLGAKADKELIRKGASAATVSGVFSDPSQRTLLALAEYGLADDCGQLYIQRTIATDGRSSVKINGKSVSLGVLKSVCSGLVSIHGQSDTGELLDPAKHIELLDTYSSNDARLSSYDGIYSELSSVRLEIDAIRAKAAESERMKEILEYQIKDIDSHKLHVGEEEELVDKKIRIKNSEKLVKNAEFVYKALKGSEKGSVSYLLDRSNSALKQLVGVIPSLEEYITRIDEMLYSAEDIAEEVHALIDDIDADPTEKLNQIESRLDKISKLKRKYGFTVAEVLEFRNKAKAELDTLENSDELLVQLEKKERELYDKAVVLAQQLHDVRCDSAVKLEEKVKETLEFLDMPKVVFYTDIRSEYDGERKVLNKRGFDRIEFYISANKGADAQSISRIASGGELARIMLALKSVIADKDGVSTIIFDEIDAGVSGKTARKIGLKMRELAKDSQLFCVTHSAQVASLADKHFLISKSEVDGAVQTAVRELDYEGRINELSRILGGINITSAQREAAVDMLRAADTN